MSKFKIIAYKVTKEKLIKALEDLGWKIERWQDDFFAYPYTPKGERISWHILNDRIETTNDYDFSIVCAFYFKDCYLEKQKETVCLRQKNSKSVFILFHNFQQSKQNIGGGIDENNQVQKWRRTGKNR